MCSFKNAEPSRNKQISFSNFQHQLTGCTEYTCTALGTCNCTHTSEGGKLISQSKQNWDNFQATKRIQNLKLLPFPVKIKQRFLYPLPPSPPPIIVILQKIRQILENTNKDSWAFSDKRIIGGPLPPPHFCKNYLYEGIDLET